MKIAILTFHNANNYGALLQAYALQTFLDQNFGQAFLLDYHNDRIDKSYRFPCFSDYFKKTKASISRLIHTFLLRKRYAKMECFRQNFFKLSRRYDRNSIKDASNETDTFVVGSDQVWNPLIIGDDWTYFFDFADDTKIKCSYSASIGLNQIPSDYQDLFKRSLKRFKALSVRESSAVSALNDLGFESVCKLPDPVTLISKNDWEKFIEDYPRKIQNGYIFLYKITRSDKLISFAKMLSRKTGLPIIYLPNDLKDGFVGSLKINVGPQEWLSYIKHADYVVTNSFHGTLFSIIFGTKFFAEISSKVNPTMSRLSNLLEDYGLVERRIDLFSDKMLDVPLQTDRIEAIKSQAALASFNYFKVFFGTVQS